MMTKEALYIGIMSGTSLDGVDTALVSIKDREINLLASDFLSYPESLKTQVLAICHGQETNLKHIGELDHQLGLLYAEAVNSLLSKTTYTEHDIAAIGNHGQTVFHQPDGAIRFTTQLGDNNLLATLTGIDTIGDFRRKDMALGGQGAPLVPAFHRYLFADSDSTQVILNIGGISNVSILQPNGEVIGFDTGPGNVLLDHWCSHAFCQPFDKDAQLAAQGNVLIHLLDEMLKDNYLKRPAPKSTGREHYHEQWLKQCLDAISTPINEHDVLRTLTEFTALTIANAIENYPIGTTPKLLVCGGGANNPIIMKRLSELLKGWNVAPTDSEAISGDYMESMAFAWLAHCYLNKIPSNLPSVTGASKAVPLGVFYSAD